MMKFFGVYGFVIVFLFNSFEYSITQIALPMPIPIVTPPAAVVQFEENDVIDDTYEDDAVCCDFGDPSEERELIASEDIEDETSELQTPGDTCEGRPELGAGSPTSIPSGPTIATNEIQMGHQSTMVPIPPRRNPAIYRRHL